MSFLKSALRNKPKIESSNRYKLADDKKDHAIRIVPFNKGGVWSYPHMCHWAPAENGDRNAPYLCPAEQPAAYVEDANGVVKTFGMPCVFDDKLIEVNAELEQLENDRSENGKKRKQFLRSLSWSLQARKSFTMFVIDREDEGFGIKEFAAPDDLYTLILDAYTGAVMKELNVQDTDELMNYSDDQIPDLFDFRNGFDVILRKTPRDKGNGFIYHVSIAKNASPVMANMSDFAAHLKRLKDPIATARQLIEDQSDQLAGALARLITKTKAKNITSTPLRGSSVSDDSLFGGAESGDDELPHLQVERPSRPQPQRQQDSRAQRPTTRRTEAIEAASDDGDSPSFQEEDPADAEFTKPVVKGAGAGRTTKVADLLKGLDADE